MKYVFDNSPLSALLRNYYPGRFPTLWKIFDKMITDGEITSTREAFREMIDLGVEFAQWAKDHEEIFAIPSAQEALFVAEIYKVKHFQQNIERQKILKGGKNADPFLIARAKILEIPLVTMERYKRNAVKIPNVCEHFKVECLHLEKFMERENWQF